MSDTVIEVATFLLHGVRTLLAYIVLGITSHYPELLIMSYRKAEPQCETALRR